MSNIFHSDCNITDGTYKGVGGIGVAGGEWEAEGGGGWEAEGRGGWEAKGGGGWEAEGRPRLPLRDRQQLVCVQQVAQIATIHRTGRDSRWLQFGTTHILINAIQWLHRPCGTPSWFDRLEKSPL